MLLLLLGRLILGRHGFLGHDLRSGMLLMELQALWDVLLAT
jgi:hypothetical protein